MISLLEALENQTRRRSWSPYASALFLVALATLIGVFALYHVNPTNIVMLYLLVVVVSGLLWGQGPAVFSSVVGVIAFDYFMVPPRFSLTVEDAEYLMTFAGLLSVALVIGTLSGRLRDRALILKRREREASDLVSFIRALVAVEGLPAIAEVAARHVRQSLGRPAALVWSTQDRGQKRVSKASCDLASDELAVTETALIRGNCPEGVFSPCPILKCMAFSTVHGLAGILVVRLTESGPMDASEEHLLEAYAAQAATVMEKATLADAAHRAEMLEETERLHDALLNSVSHALRTPLASIIGSLSALEGQGEELREPVAVDLIETAKEEAERLNLLVRDLLDMTRLQSGHLKLNLDWYDLEDVIGAALAGARDSLAEHPVRVELPSQPLLVRLDEVLIVQVLDNLLENSCKYSEPGSPIEVQVRRTADSVEITVADWGPGIPAEDSERVFDKFYRSVKPGGGPPGSGLGLAICRGIVEAHGGRIWTRACTHPGTEMVFTLPLGEVIAGGEHGD